jgi:nitrate reductase NapAB chaperone NapD
MAIAGVLVHCLKENVREVQARIESMQDMTAYGVQKDEYLVVVAEAPSSEMEKSVERLEKLDGVLAVYTTYVTIEDELTDAPI